MNYDLAVIIPAYKDKFLDRALNSIASQTSKYFNVYVGDDNSPFDLRAICETYKSKLNIKYVKFPDNIGAKNIVDQWIRCIELSVDEKWIWLFSDDDIADSICVEKFYTELNKQDNNFDVYRFNTRVIDDNDRFISQAQESPNIESAVDMAFNILMGKRGNSMPDHIFSREIYNKYGFVKTDWAQGADWATSIQFASDKGMCTIPDAKISWRLGSFNISGTIVNEKSQKIKGHIQFLSWLMNFFKSHAWNNYISYKDFKLALYINLENVIRNHYKGLKMKNFFNIYSFYCYYESIFSSFYKVIGLYYRNF